MDSSPNVPPWQPVLDFWFGAPPDAAPRPQWFRKSEAFDAEIRARFADLVEAALAGSLRDWDHEPDGALARIVLLDQFTRNIFRGSARAFAGDALALAAARAMVAAGRDRLLRPPIKRWFVYLPFEHAEDLQAQDESLRLFAALAADDPGADGIEWARRHHDVIARFGRFPHRNAALGRASTPAEIEFLRQPGSQF